MNSEKYWRDREEIWQKQQIKDDKKRMQEIASRMRDAQDAIRDEIGKNWDNFSNGQKITLEEAFKRSSEMDVKAFASKAKKYVNEKDFSKEANRELKLYNLTMRVNRLELLKANIGLELVNSFDGVDKYFSSELTKAGMAELKRQAGILAMTLSKSGYGKFVGKVVDGSFQAKNYPTFSENLWRYQSELKADLDKLLIRGITLGRNPKQLTTELSRLLTDNGKENAKYNIDRLLVSETTRVQASIQEQSYLDAGVEEYEYIAEPNACGTCKPMDGKIFSVRKMMSGLNAPGMHPWCRCSTALHIKGMANSLVAEQARKITPKNDLNRYTVNRNIVNTKHYHDKFSKIGLSKNLYENIYKKAVESLERRDGTELEDIFAFNSRTGELIAQNIKPDKAFASGISRESFKNATFESITLLHNHPESGRLSFADIKTIYRNEDVSMSIAVGHDGTIHAVSEVNRNKDLIGYHAKWYTYYKSLGFTDQESQLRATDKVYEKGWFKYVAK